jgi:hypothetical protein
MRFVALPDPESRSDHATQTGSQLGHSHDTAIRDVEVIGKMRNLPDHSGADKAHAHRRAD